MNAAVPSRHRAHTFKLVMTRQLSVVMCQYWEAGERLALPKAFGASIFFDPLFVYRPRRGVDVYYDFSDPRQWYRGLIRYCLRQPRIVLRRQRSFERDCRTIKEIAKRPRPSDFRRLFQLLVRIWPMVAFH